MPQAQIPASIGQQIFTISSGVAGGLAGFVLATKLRDVRQVPTSAVFIASTLSAVVTFSSIYLITSQLQRNE